MRRFALIVCVAVGAVFALLVSRGAPGSGRPDLSRFSTHGRVVRVQGHPGTLIATRDGRSFYRYATADGRCFAIGSAADASIGVEACLSSDTFPSIAHPLLDLSIYESRSHDRSDELTLYRVEGFAADGVAAVGVVNRAGNIGLRVPVSDNVYVLNNVPPGLTGSIVALDRGGAKLSAPNH